MKPPSGEAAERRREFRVAPFRRPVLGQVGVDLTHRGRPAVAVEDRLVGVGRIGKEVRRRGARLGLRRLDQLRRALRPQEMGGVEFARGRASARAPLQIGRGVRGEFAGHQGRGVRVEPQVHDRAVGLAVRHVVAAVGPLLDQVGVAGVAVLGAVLLQRGQPRLADELEEAGGRRGAGLGGRIEAALAVRRLHQEREIDARRLGRALDRALNDSPDALDRHARTPELSWLMRR